MELIEFLFEISGKTWFYSRSTGLKVIVVNVEG
jgi:hypothetical protein